MTLVKNVHNTNGTVMEAVTKDLFYSVDRYWTARSWRHWSNRLCFVLIRSYHDVFVCQMDIARFASQQASEFVEWTNNFVKKIEESNKLLPAGLIEAWMSPFERKHKKWCTSRADSITVTQMNAEEINECPLNILWRSHKYTWCSLNVSLFGNYIWKVNDWKKESRDKTHPHFPC